jgi:AcrR family transcriptional regulator
MKKRNGTPARPRGRPRSFDRDAALERAMEVFWKHGFEGTSLSDLTEAMDINPPSLYAAFGDKENLFLEAVLRYQATRRAACPYADAPTARDAVEVMLTYAVNEFAKPGNPPGCMMVMAATTSTTSSPKLQAALAEIRAGSRAHLKARIDRGLREGELPRGTDTGALADFYATILSGMSLQARDGASRKRLLATVAAAMGAWPENPRRTSKRLMPQRRAAVTS